MNVELVTQVGDWGSLAAGARLIRESVFVREQGVPAALEYDGLDPECRHALVSTGAGEPIATGRLLPDGRIGRIAVAPAWRGRGVGRTVMLALINEAKHARHHEVVLNAQVSAVPFYLGLGFEPYGDGFVEAGIPHQAMRLVL